MVAVRDNSFVGNFCSPNAAGKHPGVIVIGGSQGGIDRASGVAELLAGEGYAALSVAYFKYERLPKQLKEIPLEYFKQAIDWMTSNTLVDSDRIGLVGTSKGGEASLLLSATYSKIRAVVAYVPSHVVFQGIDYRWPRKKTAKSSWTMQGKPIPFVPYRYSFKMLRQHGFLQGLYLNSLQNVPAVEQAIIPVEQIECPILLISGKLDTVWPSSLMCACVEARLKGRDFGYPYRHLCYDNAGHISPGPGEFLPARPMYIGGTVAGNAAARDSAWKEVRRFLEKHLKKEKPLLDT